MDPLVELPLKYWPRLQQKLKRRWPLNVAGYYALFFNMTYPRVRDAFQFKAYCPYGDMDNGFVGKSFKGITECIMFPTTEDTRNLEEALINTTKIDWAQGVKFNAVPSSMVPALDFMKSTIGFSNYKMIRTKMLFRDRQMKPFKNLSCPGNTYLAPVTKDHLKLVDKTWFHRHADSLFYFSTLAANDLSYGLYSSHTHELLAWLFICEYNYIRHMFCKDGYRKRGYMEFLVKYVINELLMKDSDVYGYVIEGNEMPMTMLTKGVGDFKMNDSAIIVHVKAD